MPSYQVTAPGFMFGRTYSPTGKRRVLHSDAPLKPVPSWLKPIVEEKKESAKDKKAREAAEAAAAKVNEDQKKEIDAVTFLDPNNPVSATQPSSTVTL